MKILVCNDDGIDSAGISALAKSLSEIGEVVVVAPRTEQSAVGHKITMQIPLRVIKYYKNGDFFGYAVSGTPADCIKMAVKNILGEKPDLVVSGINTGANTAISVIYSGTVSAAREAAIMDIPAIAISITSHTVKNFDYGRKVAKKLANQVIQYGLPKGTLLNVNIPDLPEEEIKGIKLSTQSKAKWDDIYEERVDPYGNSYFWLTGNMVGIEGEKDTDLVTVKENYVSVTPIHFDLTDYKQFEAMKAWNI